MKSKAAIALIFGLIFQLAQVLPGLAAVMADDRIPVVCCECCAGLDSCPCAEEGEPAPPPLPLAPDSSQNLKVPLAKTTGTHVSLETFSGQQGIAPSVISTSVTGPWTGYTGVPLSVAFCSFVI